MIFLFIFTLYTSAHRMLIRTFRSIMLWKVNIDLKKRKMCFNPLRYLSDIDSVLPYKRYIIYVYSDNGTMYT